MMRSLEKPSSSKRMRGLVGALVRDGNATSPAVVARGRAPGDIEPAPKRRLVAREREDALMDAVPTEEREAAARANVRSGRARARARARDMGVRP
jgi:hypothetical protein